MEDGDGDTFHLEDSVIRKIVGCSPDQVTDDESDDDSDSKYLYFQSLAVKRDKCDNTSNSLVNTGSGNLNLVEIDVPKVKVNGDVNSTKGETIGDLIDSDNDAERSTDEIVQSPIPATGFSPVEETINKNLPRRGKKRKIFENTVLNKLIDDISSARDNIEFKESKKPMLVHDSVNTDSIKCANEGDVKPSTDAAKGIVIIKKCSPVKLKKASEPSTPQAEYAQYLGLQPTVKFRCYKCGETGFPCMPKLQEHQDACLNNVKLQSCPKPILPRMSPDPSTNIRITRKVYLCSACGTYYENWNLFLHMRQVHKRHICLFCLAMFVQAEKLAAHLISNHNITEVVYTSPEHLLSEISGPYFFMCTTCEKVFTERDHFSNHVCSTESADRYCSQCNLRGTHLPTCHLSSSHQSAIEFTGQPHLIQAHSSKYLIPMTSVPRPIKMKPASCSQSTLNNSKELSDVDDDYDICNAASFCHVNIHEPLEKQQPSVTTNKQQEVAATITIHEPITIDLASEPTGSELSTAEDSVKHREESSMVSVNESTPNNIESLPIQEDRCGTPVRDELITLPPKSPDSIAKEDDPNSNCDQVMEDVPQLEKIPESSVDSITAVDKSLLTECTALEPAPVNESRASSSPSEPPLTIVTPPSPTSPSPTNENVSELSSRIVESDVKTLPPVGESCEMSQTQLSSELSQSPNNSTNPSKVESPTPMNDTTSEPSAGFPTAEEPAIPATIAPPTEAFSNIALVTNTSKRSTPIRPPASKRPRRKKVNFKSRSSKAKSKQPKPEVTAAPVKTPLTLKFIKTSSTANANYRTAIDGNLLEFDNSDYDTNTVDPSSSPDSSGKPEELYIDFEAEALAAKLAEEQAFLDSIQVAGEDVPAVEMYLEDKLESLTIQALLQECVKTVCLSCVYCGHAKKIAVNGKQLALHLLAEHRFLPIYKESSFVDHLTVDAPGLPLANVDTSIEELSKKEAELIHGSSEELSKDMVTKLKSAVSGLQELFLNTETYDSSDRSFMHPYDRTYECFQCNFLTTLHKDLYVHNRKMHQKTILLCIMCKSNFYSYSELLCHLCPGIYIPDNEIKFRCCVCVVDSLPSAFRLMVHLRKRHNCCDVCLEVTDDQQKLSNHVWKHKLHHLCYRCGIAYRNKPDITKHLFWKHGTESVLCKKCLQKKWPHVYHFCIPPNAFICEECNTSFSRAVSLKVHKRIHSGDLLYGCEECEERFVSKMLLAKHQDTHREIPVIEAPVDDQKDKKLEEEVDQTVTENQESVTVLASNCGDLVDSKDHLEVELKVPLSTEKKEKHMKKQSSKKSKAKVVDVYDLPPLNLSSESDDSGDEKGDKQQTQINPLPDPEEKMQPVLENSQLKMDDAVNTEEENHQPVQTVDGVWDNFQNYKANLERRESQSNESFPTSHNPFASLPFPLCSMDPAEAVSIVMGDHDYCASSELKQEESMSAGPSSALGSVAKLDDVKQASTINLNSSLDHDYCGNQSTPSSLSKSEVPKEEEKPAVIPEPSHRPTQSKESPVKKKQKSVRRDKSTMSSSSSDSSSSSSSSCSCKTNCSCSSSSSTSSGSSSDSSESDSSTSEGRRLQIARRQQRREARKKKSKEEPATALPTQSDQVAEQPVVPAEPEVVEEPIHESDLETDETETDEDFYDQHPQLLANKLLAEKRNQLLLLAAVAPGDHIMTPPESLPPPSPEPTLTKKKSKSKKRKKHQHDSERKAANRTKLNTTSGYYIHQTSAPEPIQPPIIYSLSSNTQPQQPSHVYIPPHHRTGEQAALTPAAFSAESGSETDSKRLSKRRRLPKKFYGDSSDEDSTTQSKWTSSVPLVNSSPVVKSLPPSPGYKSPQPPPAPVQARVPPMIIVPSRAEPEDEDDNLADSESEQEELKKSSSDSSSNSEPESDAHPVPPLRAFLPPPIEHAPGGQRNDNLYCYCQCPYDEVSEMIACDGKDCMIEWFHFECVGIMVPPRGKWYCPDCRKASTSKTW